MSLLWIDGFDHLATADIVSAYTSIVGSPTISSSLGRRSSGCLIAPNNTSAATSVLKAIPASSAVIVGCAIKVSDSASGGAHIIRLLDATTNQVGVRLNAATRTLSVTRNLTTVLATSTYTLPTGIFNYVEFKATIHDTTGSYELRVNGETVLSATNVDTKQSTNASADGVAIGPEGNIGTTGSWSYDDLYICDALGSVNNNFLGDSRVDTVLPNADGNYTSWTPSTGSSHFALVDETTPNTSDYNSSSVATNKDSYGLASVPALSSQLIHGVMLLAYASKSDAGSRSVKVGVRSGSTDNMSSSYTLATGYKYYQHIAEVDPNTSVAWTESGVNASELVVETV